MRPLNLLLLLFPGIIFFSSCTITKRHFGNGYHVEWKRKITAEEPEKEIEKFQLYVTSEVSNHPEYLVFLPDTIDSADEAKTDVIQAPRPPKEVLLKNPAVQSEKIQSVKKFPEIYPENPEKKEMSKPRMHPLMWGIWGMWSIAIACMFFVTFYAEFLIGVALGFFIAMIFAFIVINALRTYPMKYRCKGLSYGFVIPAIVFGTIAFLGVLIFLLGGVPLGPGG